MRAGTHSSIHDRFSTMASSVRLCLGAVIATLPQGEERPFRRSQSRDQARFKVFPKERESAFHIESLLPSAGPVAPVGVSPGARGAFGAECVGHLKHEHKEDGRCEV